MSEEGHQLLLAKANPALRDLLIALNDTGARPDEIVAVEAKDFRPDMDAWVLQEHKSERTGHPRVIYLPHSVLEITRRRVAEFPSGPIFRNTCSRPWDIKSVETWFQRARKQLGLGPVTLYSYRHKFATEFLLAGGSMAVLAELLDNSILVIEHHYSHIREHGPQLRKHLTDFRPHDRLALAEYPGPLIGPGLSRLPEGPQHLPPVKPMPAGDQPPVNADLAAVIL